MGRGLKGAEGSSRKHSVMDGETGVGEGGFSVYTLLHPVASNTTVWPLANNSNTHIPSSSYQGRLEVHQGDLLLQHLLGEGSGQRHSWVRGGGGWRGSPQTSQGFSVAL